jgi:uncharacterized membrane protein
LFRSEIFFSDNTKVRIFIFFVALVLKELIGSLGSNKTEHAIITVSIAAPVIQDIVNNVDQMVNAESKQSSHKKKFLKKMS